MEINNLEVFLDALLQRTGLEIAPELRAEFAEEMLGQLLERSILELGVQVGPEGVEQIQVHTDERSPEDTLKYLQENFPQFQTIAESQFEILVEDLKQTAEEL